MSFIESFMMCLGGNSFKWYIMRGCRSLGVHAIYIVGVLHRSGLATVTSIGAGDGMRVMG